MSPPKFYLYWLLSPLKTKGMLPLVGLRYPEFSQPPCPHNIYNAKHIKYGSMAPSGMPCITCQHGGPFCTYICILIPTVDLSGFMSMIDEFRWIHYPLSSLLHFTLVKASASYAIAALHPWHYSTIWSLCAEGWVRQLQFDEVMDARIVS